MRQKSQDSIGINQNYYRLSIIIFLNLRLYVDKLKLTDFCQICDFPFLVSKISKLDSKVKKINNFSVLHLYLYEFRQFIKTLQDSQMLGILKGNKTTY
jgi:hypothetical protein